MRTNWSVKISAGRPDAMAVKPAGGMKPERTSTAAQHLGVVPNDARSHSNPRGSCRQASLQEAARDHIG